MNEILAYRYPTKDKIRVQFYQYDPVFVERIRLIGGARWIKAEREWEIPMDLVTLNDLRKVFPAVAVSPSLKDWEQRLLSKQHFNLEHKRHPHYTDKDWSQFPFPIKPYQHQIKALDLMYENIFFGLAMSMGTGKSAVVVWLTQVLKEEHGIGSVLVVCPLSVVGNWEREFEKHGRGIRCEKLIGNKYERKKNLGKDADVYIINYEGMRLLKEDLKQCHWSMMVCDESHRIKNRTAQQSKACFEVGKRTQRKYILTGTMITNNPLDAFGQFKFLNESILGSNYYAFQNRYAVMVTNGRARFPVRFINLDDLSKKISPWIYRVTKEECLDLPDKVYETREVTMNDKAKRIYKSLSRELMAEIDSMTRVTAPIVLTKLLRFSQITAGFVITEDGSTMEVGNEKINELESILEQTAGQVVVWCRFIKEMDMVCRRIDKLGIKYGRLDGSKSQKDREEVIRRFTRNELRVFVGQIEAGGIGINLNTASTCVYMSNPFSLGSRLQSEDRLHRIGQKNNVTYIDLVMPNTIDQKILGLIQKKKDLAEIINQDKKFVKDLIGIDDAQELKEVEQ